MRNILATLLIATISLTFGAFGCDSSPREACENVAVVCNGNPNLTAAGDACVAIADTAPQSVLNCIDAASTCDALIACIPSS